ncbi:MAG: TonB family protein [Pseudotabrizicola sp.]|uniref:energy transducer TonB n=1 Tax=Pseudotabrizicola sp. TaxID=2939647 RepID=UPI002720C61E|nr:energy transducer TonB [Pseudotabrizicola sp.]MDO8885175.1 TonB family protein [Pseudotabrizicola sp.]MDP2081406.1 TonB family protein [Pseudotabrizicola sp.]MDZ7572919.1 TonB family protein [Pseudotabrizicola sp.]
MKKARLPFVAALALSGALHAAGAIAIAPHEDLAVEGGAPATIALLGEAFEDLAQGAQPVAATSAPPAPTGTAQFPPITAAAMAPPPLLPSADVADLALPVAATMAPTPATPTLAQTAKAETAAPDRSPRPRARLEKPLAKAPPTEKRAAKSAAPVPAGNADRAAHKGSQDGQEAAPTAAASGAGNTKPAQQAGNAARSSYPGLVLRKIEGTRKTASSARGTVVVAFRVASSGALASARVARSTGDPSLERAALDHIRRAAPFPPPPAGAETEFRFEFVGRR